ncbi:pantetheinase-like isoform X2 [Centruroides sculpturatus]|uniref:pantetheinase-like isoform X2 n=1 Tax=Centruroides sculpturatus TaxID=218467 RepID=UPI000C6DA327|nr:pantetheinase-like isoform X2 [Centruroides sculpturatus]
MAARRIGRMLATFLVLSSSIDAEIPKRNWYVAAVFEHIHRSMVGPFNVSAVLDNLEAFSQAADVAAQHDVDILVFPEMAILPPSQSRQQIFPLLEEVPDPEKVEWNPCVEGDEKENVITRNLSCSARRNNMYVVGNLGRKEKCEGDSGCPYDGYYHFNTNVVFDREGTLIARYDKHHLYLEDAYNVPPHPKLIAFTTEFGTFGTFTCFDIIYYEAVEFVRDFNLTGIIYPVWWFDERPFLSSIQMQESWAIRHNITLLASNVHFPFSGSMGSGIYLGEKGASTYTHVDDNKARLLIARVGSSSSQPLQIVTHSEEEPLKYRFYEFDLKNSSLIKLEEPSGQVETCLGGLCCKLTYQTSTPLEGYYLAAVNEIRSGGRKRYFWCEESCILIRCNDKNNKNCSTFPILTETVFHSFHLEGNFSSQYVYPNVLVSYSELLPVDEWKFDIKGQTNIVQSKGSIDRPILSVSLYGRCYHRDPPYAP